jgi:hypothetical protein
VILGLSIPTFTMLHVVVSLVGIASGVLVLLRPSASTKASSLNTLFLATTIAASVTGLMYMFVVLRFRLGHQLSVVSLAVLAPAVLALYRYRLTGAWRAVFVAGSTIALYLNGFIAVRQAFAKIDFLRMLPPTEFASPILLAHLLVLSICLWLGFHAYAALQPGAKPRRARPRPLRVADRWS